MNIFCISGLGADERIFSKLDLHQHRVKFIPWLTPEKNESMAHYTGRLAALIDAPEPVLIGVSFGGMVSIEISKILPVRKIILISSMKTKFEMPFYFRMASALRLNKIVPLRPYKFLASIEDYNLGISNPEEKALAADYREHLNVACSDWSIDQVLHWKNTFVPLNLVHIHGSSDHILPIRYIKADYVIKGGGHLMVMNKADEISVILHKILGD